MAPTKEMLKISLKYKPNFVCIVPEKRKEITTEGGLNLKYNLILIKKIVKTLKKSKIRVSLFIEPNIKDIKIAKKINADCVEIHVGKLCILHSKKKNTKKEFEKIKKSIHFANEIGLEAHAGHGITFSSAKILSKIKGIKEFNIGHFLIAESIFIGMKKCIKIFKKILKK
jgi:pyridoxine 5-phosphate synthase